MKDDQERMVDDAFLMIQTAVSRVGGTDDIDGALDEIRHAVNQIEPQLLLAAKRLTTQEIGEVLAGFFRTVTPSRRRSDGQLRRSDLFGHWWYWVRSGGGPGRTACRCWSGAVENGSRACGNPKGAVLRGSLIAGVPQCSQDNGFGLRWRRSGNPLRRTSSLHCWRSLAARTRLSSRL